MPEWLVFRLRMPIETLSFVTLRRFQLANLLEMAGFRKSNFLYDDLFLCRTSAGAEIDLVVRRGSETIAVEMKATSAPQLNRGFWSAISDLAPIHTWIAAHVEEAYSIERSIDVAPPSILCSELEGFIA